MKLKVFFIILIWVFELVWDYELVINVDFLDENKFEYINRFYLGMRNEICGCIEFYGKFCCEFVNYDEIIKYWEFCKELFLEEVDIVIEFLFFVYRNRGKEI